MPEVETETGELLAAVYRQFNARDIDAILARMSDDVEWPRAFKGGYVQGHAAVRDYWSRQWAEIDPTVTPVGLAGLPDGRVDVTVHQIVRGLDGAVLSDSTVHHVYRLDNGRIRRMDIRE